MADANEYGYRNFQLGGFTFKRDEYFVAHRLAGRQPYDAGRCVPARADARRVVEFLSTASSTSTRSSAPPIITAPSMFSRVSTMRGYRAQNKHYVESFKGDELRNGFAEMLADWTNEGFDPFAAPEPKPARPSDPSAAAIRRRSIASGWSHSA